MGELSVPAGRRGQNGHVDDRSVGRADQQGGEMAVNGVTGGHVLHLSGDIDAAVVEEFVRSRRLEGLEVVAVDVGDLGYIDSTGLAFLVRWAKEARRSGRPSEIRRTTERFERVLELTGLDTVFVRQ
jgi:anti-anti-sigma factor